MAGLLEVEADSAEELALRIIQELDDERAKHQRYAVISQAPAKGDGVKFHVVGPYSTLTQAQKALEKGLTGHSAGEGVFLRWSYLSTPRRLEMALEAADAPPKDLSVPYGHPVPFSPDDIKSRKKALRLSKEDLRRLNEERTA